MKLPGRILIVDDDTAFLDSYRELLGDEGYEVATATTREAALERLDQGGWDVVLLDQKLLGPSGPDEGIDLVNQVHARAPGAKPIIVTAYATDKSIERAFDAGVYDFLEKKGAFKHLLRAKLRNAIEAVRERDLGYLHDDDAERQIDELWSALRTEPDGNIKGRMLEQLMLLIFRSIDGFKALEPRRKSQDEEIDLVIRNDVKDGFWSRQSPYFLAECKNWSSHVGANEFDLFRAKLRRRFGQARLGFFIAPGGYTKDFHSRRQAAREGEELVICIGEEELAQLVQSKNRGETLEALHGHAIVHANGS